MLSDFQTESKKEFRQRLIDFMSSVAYSELITASNNIPHIRPMVYVNDGLTIYMCTRKDSQKIKQIMGNPNVSVMIIKSLDVAVNTQEVIIEGKADIVPDEDERKKVFDLFVDKPQNFQEWVGKDHNDFEVIKITPHLVRFFDYSNGEGRPRTLTVH